MGRMGERNTTHYTSSKLLGKGGNIYIHTHTPIFSDLCVLGVCVYRGFLFILYVCVFSFFPLTPGLNISRFDGGFVKEVL